MSSLQKGKRVWDFEGDEMQAIIKRMVVNNDFIINSEFPIPNSEFFIISSPQSKHL
jgi:hypothetical protein